MTSKPVWYIHSVCGFLLFKGNLFTLLTVAVIRTHDTVTYRCVSGQRQDKGRDKHLRVDFQSLFEPVSSEFCSLVDFPQEL